MLTEETIPEILSLMRTVDHMNKNEHIWKGDADIAEQTAQYNKLVESIFTFMTPEERDRILELYRMQGQKKKT